MAARVYKIDFSKSEPWICAALVSWNLFSKLPFITSRDLSWDEPFSAFYSQFPVGRIIQEIFKGNNPPLYELFLHFYTALFGISETALRLPSLLFSCGTVAFLFYTGCRLKGKWLGIFVSLLFIFNNLQFFYSLAARMYALFSMLVAASVWFSVVAYQEPGKKKYFYGWLAVNVLMCYTHYFAGFVILAEVLAWLITFPKKEFFKRTFLVFAANTLAVIPMLLVFKQRADGYVSTYNFIPPTPEIWKNVIMNLVNGMEVYNTGYSFLTMGLIAFLLLVIYQRKIDLRNYYYFILLFLLFALPLAFTWYYANTFPLFIDRYYLFTTIPLFLFAGMAIATFYRKLGAIWVPVFFIYILNSYHHNFIGLESDYLLRNWQGASLTAKSLQLKHPGSIIVIHPLWADLGFSYYYDRSLFQDPEHYNENLRKACVYRVWGNDSLNKIVSSNKSCSIVYYCDESGKVDSTSDGNFRLFQRKGYAKDTSYFYPLCTNVVLLHPADSVKKE